MQHKLKRNEIAGLKVLESPGDPEKGAIVLLHGYGANAYDLSSLSALYEGPTWYFPEGPLSIPFGGGYVGKAWFEVNLPLLTQAIEENRLDEISQAFPDSLKGARELVENLLHALKIPREKLILGGFSQGAILTLETALHSKTPPCGLVLLSGTLINAERWKTLAPNLSKTPFFLSHGTHDTILPYQKAQALEKLLTQAGLVGHLNTFHGGHEIPPATLHDLSTFLKNTLV